jgi:hypothetical protein
MTTKRFLIKPLCLRLRTHLDTYGTRALGRLFNLELYVLIFFQSVKLNIYQAALMKKYFSAVGIADKTKTSFANQLLDLSVMHLDTPFLV